MYAWIFYRLTWIWIDCSHMVRLEVILKHGIGATSSIVGAEAPIRLEVVPALVPKFTCLTFRTCIVSLISVRIELFVAIFAILLLLLQLIPQTIFADTSARVIINPDADVFVNASPEFSNSHMKRHAFLLEAGIPHPTFKIPLQIARSIEEQLISYIRFNLTEIPTSDFFNDVSVDSAKLSLVAISTTTSDRYFATISSCSNNSWSAASMTWKTRICIDHIQGQDSVIIVNRYLYLLSTAGM